MAVADHPSSLFDAARGGDRRALARLLSLVEMGGDHARRVDAVVRELAGGAHAVGLTGAPGAGKSTLTNALIHKVRDDGQSVAVLAVDPSSPYSGGAILGDRVRMGDHSLDDGVFIRSMATRGHFGGLAVATPGSVRVLDAAGYRWVIVETVGVGQVEVAVAGAADTTVVAVNPGWGDSIQASKAGLLEIGDVFVVNKSDRAGAAETRRELEQMLDLSRAADWRPPVLETTATTGDGIDELWATIQRHRAHLIETGGLEARRAERVRGELNALVLQRATERAREAGGDSAVTAMHERIVAGDLDLWSAADALLDRRDPDAQ